MRPILTSLAFFAVLAAPAIAAASRSDREYKDYAKQRQLVLDKFEGLEEKFEVLIQDYNNAKIESRDTIGQWHSYSRRWERKFGKPNDYSVRERLDYPNLRIVNKEMKDAAFDLKKLLLYFGKNIEGERDEKTVDLEKDLERRFEGLRLFINIEDPVMNRGAWGEAGDVRWRVFSARRKSRDKYRGTRLAMVKFKVHITGEFVKRIDTDAFMLMSQTGRKIGPKLKFDATFAYPDRKKPPFGKYIDNGVIHSYALIFEVPEKEREFILRLTDLEPRTKAYTYFSLKI